MVYEPNIGIIDDTLCKLVHTENFERGDKKYLLYFFDFDDKESYKFVVVISNEGKGLILVKNVDKENIDSYLKKECSLEDIGFCNFEIYDLEGEGMASRLYRSNLNDFFLSIDLMPFKGSLDVE